MLLIRKTGDSTWHAPTVTSYPDERAIQTLLEQSPELLPGVAGDRLAIVSEVSVPSVGSADLIAVDAEGGVTIVECKLKANPEIRRQVIGQLLAYASGLWEMSCDDFDRAFQARAGASLAQRVAELNPEEWDGESFRTTVTANLASGRFCLVVAVDEITEELKRIILYLNEHTVSEVQVLALELGYVADVGVEILVPAVYGEESVQAKKASSGRRWDEQSVFAVLAERCTPAGVQAACRLFDYAKGRKAQFNYGTSPVAWVSAKLPIAGKHPAVIGFWVREQPVLYLDFSTLRSCIPRNSLEDFVKHLRAAPELAEHLEGLEAADFNRGRSIPIDTVLTRSGVCELVIDALNELMQCGMEPSAPWQIE